MVKRVWEFVKGLGTAGGLFALAVGLGGFFLRPSQSDTLTIPNSFSVGQVADPSQVNANFDAIKNVVNGKIDNDNWDTSGPDLACSNIDLTSPCVNSTYIVDGAVATADLANNAATISFTLASPADIASATICGATGAYSDITGASWSVTGSGGTFFGFFHATTASTGTLCAGSVDPTFRWNINGTGYNGMVESNTSGGATTFSYDIFGVGVLASGATTVKMQCSCPAGASATGSIKNMRAAAFELKR